jgi:hypothetical protein
LSLLVLAGCAAAPPGVPEAKQSWQGASYDTVVARWGQPTRGETLPDGREQRTWISEFRRPRGAIFPSFGIGIGGGNVGVGVGVAGAGVPVGEDVQTCERTLVFADGKVVDQTWTGNESFCATLRP